MSLPLVIGITGPKRAGKDTLARFLVERHGYRQRSFAAPLKAAALALDPVVCIGGYGEEVRLSEVVQRVGWERAKDEEPEVRRTLQRLGTEVGRGMFGEDAWVNLAGPWPQQEPTVFADVRFDNEALAVIQSRGVVVEVQRPGYERGGDSHASENGIDPRLIRGYVINNSTPEMAYESLLALLA